MQMKQKSELDDALEIMALWTYFKKNCYNQQQTPNTLYWDASHK